MNIYNVAVIVLFYLFCSWIDIAKSCDDFEHEYVVAVFKPLDNFYLKTACYSKLLSMIRKESSVVISGPKGTGKSFSLVALLAYYSRGQKMLSY